MNEVMQTIKERRSVRKYKPDMPPKELIDQVVEAGLYAASGGGTQKVLIIAVTNKEFRDKLAAVNADIANKVGLPQGKDPFFGAPVVLSVLADKNWVTHLYDGTLAMGNMMLAAKSLGLGSCWIHRAKEEFEMDEYKALLTELGIEGEYEGIGHCVIGYPEGVVPNAAQRKPGRVYYID